ncbi:hypothetical protein KUV80_04025 [Fictibacillus nanhaiensis]|uniref:hypothetical protein n=1 Tax=Fictibacillus nanhaiensis TaxID=742169 RepID=UPI001C93770C|nr:hypothetical protein [Fictibacillus nanhaiensis]MBY6035802.1 hypothetical protein [Fictibacillus nanhaiensis]
MENRNKSITNGIIGGIVGGILFGLLMQMMGQLGMVASMMGSDSLVMGWFIHMVISVIFGAIFGAFAMMMQNLWVLTIVFGIGIWVAGPLVVMPLIMGMGTNLGNAFTPQLLMSLGTHLLFSVIVAIVYKVVSVNQEKSNVTA